MQAAVNEQGCGIFVFKYFHAAVVEELFIFIKFDNVIKVLAQNDYSNIKA